MTSITLELTTELLRRPSITPDDAGCLDIIAARLRPLGFQIEMLPFADVTNLWATRGTGAPVFTFAGHTDVVPTGDLEAWGSDPFTPEIRGERLYARGAADMKGSLAAMITAIERFLGRDADHDGTLSLLLTSDEEGIATNGTVKVIETLRARGQTITWCLVGEPSSHSALGDVIRNGRRGSLNGRLLVRGIQGHVAYPDQAANPIHLAAPALAELSNTQWDDGNEFYPPTSFQISNIGSGTGVENVIPATLEARFNFRFGTASTVADLQQRVVAILDSHGLDYTIDWHLSGEAFLTPGGALLDAVSNAIRDVLTVDPRASTGGGTSDGRFIAPIGAEVVEFGPVNATIHKVDECVATADLDRLSSTYESILERLLRG
jgi:succinyl-diaminopimelate desuccinylase